MRTSTHRCTASARAVSRSDVAAAWTWRFIVPIASGERLATRWQFRRLCELQACHVLQPDIGHCGGLLEARKIAVMGETYLMGVAPHNPNGPLATAMNLQFAATIPNYLILETIGSQAEQKLAEARAKRAEANAAAAVEFAYAAIEEAEYQVLNAALARLDAEDAEAAT